MSLLAKVLGVKDETREALVRIEQAQIARDRDAKEREARQDERLARIEAKQDGQNEKLTQTREAVARIEGTVEAVKAQVSGAKLTVENKITGGIAEQNIAEKMEKN